MSRRQILSIALVCCAAVAAGAAGAQPRPIRPAPRWEADSLGNHRFVLRLDRTAQHNVEAVYARVEWRRRDREPETVRMIVIDAATGRRVHNIVRMDLTREAVEFVFQPISNPGTYDLYHQPYTGTFRSRYPKLTYRTLDDAPDRAWILRHRGALHNVEVVPGTLARRGGGGSIEPSAINVLQPRGRRLARPPIHAVRVRRGGEGGGAVDGDRRPGYPDTRGVRGRHGGQRRWRASRPIRVAMTVGNDTITMRGDAEWGYPVMDTACGAIRRAVREPAGRAQIGAKAGRDLQAYSSDALRDRVVAALG